MQLRSSEILAISVAWLEEHLDLFDPRDRAPEHEIAHLKAFDELCLLGALELQSKPQSYLTKHITDHCLTVIGDIPVPTVFLDNVAHFQLMAMPAAFQMLSTGRDPLRQLLTLCIPTTPLLSAERLPNRLLDVIFCTRALKLESTVFRGLDVCNIERAAITSSNLALGIQSHLAELSDFYALTHTIFFATSFGARELDCALPGLDQEGTALTIELAILRFLCEENLDIVAELLWCLLLLDRCRGPVAAVAIVAIVDSIENFGYLRGPNLNSSVPVDDRYKDVWPHYHSTLLAIALFSNQVIESLLSVAGSALLRAYNRQSLTALYSVGRSLHEISQAHPLRRYELIKAHDVLVQGIPYLMRVQS